MRLVVDYVYSRAKFKKICYCYHLYNKKEEYRISFAQKKSQVQTYWKSTVQHNVKSRSARGPLV